MLTLKNQGESMFWKDDFPIDKYNFFVENGERLLFYNLKGGLALSQSFHADKFGVNKSVVLFVKCNTLFVTNEQFKPGTKTKICFVDFNRKGAYAGFENDKFKVFFVFGNALTGVRNKINLAKRSLEISNSLKNKFIVKLKSS